MTNELEHLTVEEKAAVFAALKLLGFKSHCGEWIEITEAGAVYVGLVEILPAGSISFNSLELKGKE
jgi:hypothetical protein